MCNPLKEQFDKWKSWWSKDDDENSLLNQIVNMMWNAAVFKIMQIGWDLVWQREKEQASLNWAVVNFIYYAHGETQAAAIARLLDTRKDVISLKRLVTDIRSHRACLTRENILDACGLPYEWESGYADVRSPQWSLCHKAKCAHVRIDQLAGVPATGRQPTDTVRECVLEWIDNSLNTIDLQSIVQYRHKFVGHAATTTSRENRNAADFQITYTQILQAGKTICQTAAFVMENILGDGSSRLPLEDIAENMDKPVIVQEDIPTVRTQWDKYKNDMKNWTKWDWNSAFGKQCP